MSIPQREEEWAPTFEVEGIEPFVDNLLQVFQRDQQAALAWASREDDLPDFEVFNWARKINQNWPALSVIARQENSVINAGAFSQTKHVVEVEIEEKGVDPSQVIKTLMRRVRAVRAMIWAARTDDLTAGIGTHQMVTPVIEVTPAIYTSFYNKKQTSYLHYATMVVSIEFLEV